LNEAFWQVAKDGVGSKVYPQGAQQGFMTEDIPGNNLSLLESMQKGKQTFT